MNKRIKKYGIVAVLGMMIAAGCVTNASRVHVYEPVDYGAVHDGLILCTANIQKEIDLSPAGQVRSGESAHLKDPVFLDKIFDIRDYGAVSDGKTKNTEAFKKAIAECAKAGGGTVLIPKGVWLTGKIHLKSNINLHVAEGAEVRFSQNHADYLPVVFTRWEGIECYNYSPLIYAKDCENVAVTGKGVFNGQGKSWWPWKRKQHPAAQRLYDSEYNGIQVKDRIYGTEEAALRPPMIQLINCRRVLLEGYTSRNSPFWNHHLVYCDGVIVRNIVLLNPHDAPNTDGIIIDSSRNVHIQGLFADVGDDAVCIKSGMNEDGWRVGRKSENIIVENCHVKRGHGGIVFGSDTSGGIRNVYVHNCVYDGTDIGIRLKSMRGRGGGIENIRIENIQMNNVGSCILLNMFYGSSSAKARSNTPPEFKNIFIKNITGKGNLTRSAITLRGLPERPIDNVVLENITINSKYGMSAFNSQNISLKNVKLIPKKSPVIMLDDCRDVDITGAVSPKIKTFLQLKGSNTDRIHLSENNLTLAVKKIVKGKKVPVDAVIIKTNIKTVY